MTLEELLAARRLPPLFEETDLTPEVLARRRREMLQLLCSEEYGIAPPAPAEVRVRELECHKTRFAGKGTQRELLLSFDTDRGEFSFPVCEVRPNGVTGKCPMFILLNFRPDVPDKYLPMEEILDAGCGVLRIDYNDVTADADDGFAIINASTAETATVHSLTAERCTPRNNPRMMPQAIIKIPTIEKAKVIGNSVPPSE